jgi:hypothetical protein
MFRNVSYTFVLDVHASRTSGEPQNARIVSMLSSCHFVMDGYLLRRQRAWLSMFEMAVMK